MTIDEAVGFLEGHPFVERVRYEPQLNRVMIRFPRERGGVVYETIPGAKALVMRMMANDELWAAEQDRKNRSAAVATDADFRVAERLLRLPAMPVIPGVRWVDPDEWEAGEPTPICDICSGTDDAPGDWNGETGRHLSCEDVSKNREVAYMKQKALLDQYRRIENGR